jgi:glycogen debranching enzyme
VLTLAEAIVLKDGGLYLVSARDGSVPLRGEHPLGLYRDDCRHLSGHELRVGGVLPRLLVATAATGHESVHELTNPAMRLPAGELLRPQTLQVRVQRRLLARGELHERIHLQLYGPEAVELDVELALAADFRPMFAIRGIVELPAADVDVEGDGEGLCFAATTSDGVRRTTTVRADRPAERLDEGTLRFAVSLRPGESEGVNLTYELRTSDDGDGVALTVPRELTETRVRADDELFERVFDRALLDLGMLRSSLHGSSYFAAGVPWFATLFGRDSLISAIEMAGLAPPIAAETLTVIAERLGARFDPEHEEEPGKVLHELRGGEAAARELTPLTRYYGTVDATPLFLWLIAEHADWSGDLSLFRRLRDPVEAALRWIQEVGDHDGDGLLDYRASSPDGLRNQGWKDSDDGVIDERGTPLEPPIALVEPQAYAIRALREMARLFEHDGDAARAAELRSVAARFEERLERFWLPERGFYAMAIDGSGRASAALASNQGHLLWARALSRERADAVREALMSDQMFSGWGLRTLGSGERGYNPLGYHLGAVWPHDTAIAAVGLRNYGFDEDFRRLFEGMLEAASHAEGYSLPELFGGFARTEYATPVPYPVACHPQAWASGALPYMLVNGLGLHPDGLNRRLRLRRPSLPGWVDRLQVEGLAIAGARVDLRFERTGAPDGGVAITDTRIEGDVEVVLEISPTR